MDDMMLSIGNPTRTNKFKQNLHGTNQHKKSIVFLFTSSKQSLKGNQESIPIYNNIFKNKVPRNKLNPGD